MRAEYSDTETEEEVFQNQSDDNINAKKGGLFHKENVEPRKYNLTESV